MENNSTESTSYDLKVLENQAWEYLSQDRYDDAISVFKKVFEKDHSNVAAYQGTIASHRKKREYVKAEELLKEALDIHPTQPGILAERAWLYLAQQKYELAIDAFNEVLKSSKKDEGIFLWTGSLLRGQRRFDEAKTVLEEAQKLFPASLRIRNEFGWLWFYQKYYDESFETFAEVLKVDKQNESALQGQVASLRMQGRFADARNIAKMALEYHSNSPGILSELGWLYFEQDCYEEAEDAFTQVIELNPKDPFAYINLAWALIRDATGDELANAARCCGDALRLEPDLSEAFGCLGVIAFKQGRLREAEAYLLRSIKANPKRGYYTDLGALYIQMGRYDEASEQLKQALKNGPDDAYTHLQIGTLYLQTEKVKKAIQEFRFAVAMSPNDPDAHRSLAIALMEGDKLIDAEKVLRNAIKFLDESQTWELHLTLCQLLTKLGDETSESQYFEEALQEVSKALRLKRNHSAPYFHSGVVRFKLEDYGGALKNFRRCLKIDEHHHEAELSARRVQARIHVLKSHSRVSLWASVFLAFVLIIQLVALWLFRFWTDQISDTMITVLVPILLGLLVVAILLPWLTRLKITGIEAELSLPNPTEALVTGPKGEVGFDNALPRSI